MPLVAESDDEKNKKNNETQSSDTTPITIGGGGGSSLFQQTPTGSAPITGNASLQSNNQGVGNTNVMNAILANPDPKYSYITNKLQSEANDVYSKMNKAYTDYFTSVGNVPAFDTNVVFNAVSNGDPTAQTTVRNWMTNQYTGPSSWDTSLFSSPYNSYKTEVENIKTQDGLYNWLLSNMAGETPGQAQLDSAAIFASPDYQSNYNSWLGQLNDLNGVQTNYNEGSKKFADNTASGYKNLNQAVVENLDNIGTREMSAFDTFLNDAKSKNDSLYHEYLNDLTQTGDYGINKGQFYKYNQSDAPTYENVLNPNQVKTYNNVQKLLGGTVLNAHGGWHPGEITFDSGAWDTAYNAAKDQEKARNDSYLKQQQDLFNQQQQMLMMMNSGGGSSAGGGISFICKELSRQNMIDTDKRETLLKKALKYPDYLWYGYWSWALPVSRYMKKSKLVSKVFSHIFEKLSGNSILGKFYAVILFIICNICSIFVDKKKYTTIQSHIRKKVL